MSGPPDDLRLLRTGAGRLAAADKRGVPGLPVATYSRLAVSGPAQRAAIYDSGDQSSRAAAVAALRAATPYELVVYQSIRAARDRSILATARQWRLGGHREHAESLRDCVMELAVCRVYGPAVLGGGTVRLHYGWWDEVPADGGELMDACAESVELDLSAPYDFRLTLSRPGDAGIIDGHISWLADTDAPLYLCAYLGDPSSATDPVAVTLAAI
jgi:hypothetical protein